MKVLLLSQWYHPEPPKLLSDLAQSLRALGHQVEVLTGFPNYPGGKLYPGYRLCAWHKESLDGVSVTRVLLYPYHGRSGLKRAVNFTSFAVAALLFGPWLVSRADVIYAVHPPASSGATAWLLSRFWHVPFVYDIHDMWPETLAATGLVKSKRLIGSVGRFMKWIYRRAAGIRVITPGFSENLLAKSVPSHKVHLISEWVDSEFFRPLDYDPVLAYRLGLNGRFNIVYAGAIALAQGLDTILDAAALLRDLPEVQFVLVGDGVELCQLKTVARAKKLTNVHFLGRYPMDAMPEIYALADALLVSLRDDPLFRITIPHKIFAYMASGKPVLGAVEGNAADIIQSVGVGLTCSPGDPRGLADLVRHFYAMTPADRQAMAKCGRYATRGLYSRDFAVGQISKLLGSLVSAESPKDAEHDSSG